MNRKDMAPAPVIASRLGRILGNVVQERFAGTLGLLILTSPVVIGLHVHQLSNMQKVDNAVSASNAAVMNENRPQAQKGLAKTQEAIGQFMQTNNNCFPVYASIAGIDHLEGVVGARRQMQSLAVGLGSTVTLAAVNDTDGALVKLRMKPLETLTVEISSARLKPFCPRMKPISHLAGWLAVAFSLRIPLAWYVRQKQKQAKKSFSASI